MASSADDLHLSFKRSGGWSPKPLTLELDERDLSLEEAAALAAVLQSGILERAAPDREIGAGGDQQQYDLTVRRGEQRQAMRFDEFGVPAELTDIVRLLERRAEEQERLRAAERRRRPDS